MQRAMHIFLTIVAIGLSSIGEGEAENKPSIATGEFLSVLAKNVATVLSPTLVGELHDGRPNRTVVNATIVLPIVGGINEAPKKSLTTTTTESTKAGSRLEADTVRSAQTQSEVRPGNNGGFPFNFDDNNYRYNYPGIGLQGGGGGGGGGGISARPDYPSGSALFNPGYYNGDFYRGGYAIERGPEGNSPRVEQVAGVSPVETIGQGQPGRLADSLDPSGPPTFDRFRNLERFPPSSSSSAFRNQFNEDGSNVANGPYRFGGGQSFLIDPFNSNHQGSPGNFPPNFRNNAAGTNNFARNYFQLGDAFQQRQQQQQQGFRSSNNFDFASSQRFQNPYDNYPRSLQRGPNFPRAYPYTASSLPRDPFTRNEARKSEEASSSELRPKSEILKNDSATNSTLGGVIADGTPEILSVQGRIRFGRLLLPTLDDYDDLRFRPDDFREYLFAPNNAANNNGNGNADNSTKNATANDV